jgi:hypothetical protein
MFLVLALVPVAWGAETASSDEFTFKIAVESHLENRLNTVLSEIAGTDNILVIVNADVKTDVSKKKRVQRQSTRQKRRQGLVLPGVPVKKELGKDKGQQTTTTNQDRPSIPTLVNRLEVTILVDNGVSEELLEQAQDIAIAVIGYNPDRGDILDVRRFDFGIEKFEWASMTHPPHLYWFIGILMAGFFLTTAALFFLNPYRKLSEVDWKTITGSGKVESTSSTIAISGGGNGEMAGMPGASPAEEKKTTESGKPMPFSFVNDENLAELAFMLKDEPPQSIATVANYIRPELTIRLMEMLPEEKGTEAALLISATSVLDVSQVEKLNNSLREQLDYVAGGKDKLASILSLVPEDIREKVFRELESRDADTAASVKKSIKTFESIIRKAKPLSVQILFRQLDTSIFARILKSASGDIQNKVLESLSEGAATMLREEMELSRPLAQNRLRKEKLNVVMVYRRLATAGLIEEDEG